jgi:hypothetical protein
VTRANPAAEQLTILATTPMVVPGRPVVRVVIPCSKRKVASVETATRAELDETRAEPEARLADQARAARDLYTGRAFRSAVITVDRFAARRPDLPVALHIASAGYGLVSADDQFVPYEAVMGTNRQQWVARGRALGMPTQARNLTESCDLTLFALSQPYFHGAALPDLKPRGGFAVVIGASSVSASPHLRSFRAGRREARALGTSEREVAAVVLDGLLARIALDGLAAAEDLPENPLEWLGR